MMIFRLVFPNGEDRSVTQEIEVQLPDDSNLRLWRDGDACRLQNHGTGTVIVVREDEEVDLEDGDIFAITQSCQFYLKGQKDRTLHQVVHASLSQALVVWMVQVESRSKRVKREDVKNFGFDLYRIRERRHVEKMPMESDLAEWFDGEVEYACLMDYMVDLDWLLSAVPSIRKIPRVLLIHGNLQDEHLTSCIQREGLSQVALFRPDLPIPFGTHHSKACIIKFPTGLRVVIHTANLIYTDCGDRTQGAWIQDFPPKREASSPSEFEQDLLQYLNVLKLPVSRRKELLDLIKHHDFTAARVKLIPSVPGYHKGVDMNKYGHLLVRHCLQKEVFPSDFKSSPLVYQFSSLGSMDEKWLYDEFTTSFSAGKLEDEMGDLGMPSRDAKGLQLVWPTINQVRNSIDGWSSGRSFPGSQKNVQKGFFKEHWHKFDGTHLECARAMPHIKTYTRFSGRRLAWVLLTSHNLSKAAWGTLQKKETQLMIRSYELGVLFLPSLELRFRQSPNRNFHCTKPTSLQQIPKAIAFEPYSKEDSTSTSENGIVHFCLPFQIPPDPYTIQDDPWMADVRQPGLDCCGRSWGQGPPMYGRLESSD